MKCAITLSAILFLSALSTAQAATGDCAETAPRYGSETYFDLEPVSPIPREQHKLLEQFAEKLHGKWRGSASIDTCEGYYADPVIINTRYTVVAEVDQSEAGALVLNAEKQRTDGRARHVKDLVALTPSIKRSPSAQRWHTLEFIDENTLIYSDKYRARNFNSFTRLVHVVRKVSYQDDAISIDRKLYVNGAIVEHSGMTLHRSI